MIKVFVNKFLLFWIIYLLLGINDSARATSPISKIEGLEIFENDYVRVTNLLAGIEKIEISEFDETKLKRQEASDCTDTGQSAYNACYGNNMIFSVCPPPAFEDWCYKALVMMRNFYTDLHASGVQQNVVIASLTFNFDQIGHSESFRIPHLFFSGSPKEVKSIIHLSGKDATESISKLPTCLKSALSQQMQDKTLESIAQKFLMDFFHYYKNPLFIFNSDAQNTDELKSSVLKFRRFIYSHFIKDDYKNFEEDNSYSTFMQTIKKLISYSRKCSGEENEKHDPILELSLMEIYLKESQAEHLKKIFDVDDVDELFGEASQKSDAKPTGMGFCFHQSEQALLMYLLENKNDKYHNDFIATLINFLKDQINANFKNYETFITTKEGPSSETPLPVVADSLPSLASLESSTPSQSSGKKTASSSKPNSEPKVPPKTIQINTDINIMFDLISPRHICKYCRGTFYLCQRKILTLMEKFLQTNGLPIHQSEHVGKKVNPNGNLYDKIITYLKLEDSKPKSLMIQFCGNINLKIFATSYQNAQEALMGKKKD